MIDCKFELNNKPMSTFWCGATKFPAFSGIGQHINQRVSACLASQGPIPPGHYYIFDRQVGGLRGPFERLFSERRNWFALYAIDSKIDDETYCDKVKRGEFRLHPKGERGISLGCITIDSPTDFQYLRTILTSAKPSAVPGSTLKAYGKVWVR
jgi:hypothetical protein